MVMRYRQRDRTEWIAGGGKCSRHGTGQRVFCLCVWLALGPGGFQLAFQDFDLTPDGFEFGFLALEEGLGDAGFFFQSGGSEQVGVLALVLVFAEVAQLDQALFDQGAQAVVGLAQAHAHLPGQLALAEAGVGLQVLERLQAPGFWRDAGLGVHICWVDCTVWKGRIQGWKAALAALMSGSVCGFVIESRRLVCGQVEQVILALHSIGHDERHTSVILSVTCSRILSMLNMLPA